MASVTHAATAPRTSRLRSLDGLRGVAAVVVLVHHALLTVPSLAAAYYPSAGPAAGQPLLWLWTSSPLHLLWAGGEAVLLFFVLSGTVLTLPALRNPAFSWAAYYPRRLVRLYVPVLVAIALAMVTIELLPRDSGANLGPWMAARPDGYSLEGLLRDLLLIDGVSRVVSPLWSLQWEVMFSLLLPIFVGFAMFVVRAPVAAAAMVTALVLLGSTFQEPIYFYLGTFAIGSLLAAVGPHVEAAAERVNGSRRAGTFWTAFLVVAVLATTSHWFTSPFGGGPASPAPGFLSVVGVTMLVLAAWFCPALRGPLEGPVAQWLGRVSFSLYLVHEPIIIGLRHQFDVLPVWLTVLMAVALSFLVAAAFTRWVEVPSHHLAKKVGMAAQRLRQTVRLELPPAAGPRTRLSWLEVPEVDLRARRLPPRHGAPAPGRPGQNRWSPVSRPVATGRAPR